jgi:tetratricopeptide (TPR) repeat protein
VALHRGRRGARAYTRRVSPRTRVVAIVSIVAAAAAAAVVGGALIQGGSAGGEVHGRTATTPERQPERPALELALTDRDDAEARELREAERLYETGDEEAARRRFDRLLAANPSSIEAAIGAAIAAWPDATIARLRSLVREAPESARAHLNLGLALIADGKLEDARRAWREAESVDPDSPAALRADDLLHPEMPPGRPQLVLNADLPRAIARLSYAEQLPVLERRAEAGHAGDWLLYGSVLERHGRRASAQQAYERAFALEPENLATQTAVAVIRFDKDDPAAAFSRLGPLAAKHPEAAIVRFHLGLMLLWLPNVAEAREQLRVAVEAAPGGFYAREARRILARLEGVE